MRFSTSLLKIGACFASLLDQVKWIATYAYGLSSTALRVLYTPYFYSTL
jgi:hypothetical protein